MSIIAAGNTTTTALVQTADTTGNLVFTTGGANTTALTLSNTQAATFAGAVTANSIASTGTVNAQNTFGFENRLINGNMVIDQRNAGASITPTDGIYTLDRWISFQSVASKYSVQQNAGSVTPPVGFINYLGTTSLSAYTVVSADYFAQCQKIEGLNVADLGWGTANAKTVTLSFWVRSSLTGTFGGALRNSGNNRSYPFSYTISAANTWEQKSVTIAGDTSGTWLTTNGIGVQVQFSLGTGPTLSGTAGAWVAGNVFAPTGSVSVVGTNGATWYVTGVQFEVGSQATSFDFRDYGRELILCQRYYQRYSYLGVDGYAAAAGSGSSISTSLWWTVQMRTAPTVTFGAAAFTQNTISTAPDIGTIAPTSSYILGQINPTAAGRAYLYCPTFATAEL